ncbi:MAG: glycosyltransferase family 2 protein [Roseobacter sp.]
MFHRYDLVNEYPSLNSLLGFCAFFRLVAKSRQGNDGIFATADFPLRPKVSPHGRITAVSMMKDEGPFVLEWVAHHLAVGFTDIVVYTNDCTDGTDQMLIRLHQLGLVHHRKNDIPDGLRPQPSALKHAQVDPVVQSSDWLMVFDADEFLCLKNGGATLDDLIDAVVAEDANGIVITWRIFGSNGIQHWSPAPVTEQFLTAAPPMWNKGWGVKTLFKFDPEYWKLGIHRPKIKNKHLQGDFPHSVKWLNGSGRAMEEYFKFRGWRSVMRTVGYDWAQMNHYAIKSMDSYAMRKRRGNVNNKPDKYNTSYWALQDRNEVYDDIALKNASRRKGIFDQLLIDPELAGLHAAAIDRVERQLAEYKLTAEYKDLIASLKTGSKVPIDQVDAKPAKPRDPQKIAARMSEIEQKLSTGSAQERLPLHRSVDALPYVSKNIDLSQNQPMQAFDNHGIKLPADPRVFSEHALQAIVTGKFMRNTARRLPDMLRSGDHYLEVGAGVGFISAMLALRRPDLHVTAQEDLAPLFSFATAVWKNNNVSHAGRRRILFTPLFDATDAQHQATGLTRLIRETNCQVLFANDPRLSDQMIAAALKTVQPVQPRTVIVGPRTLAHACDRDKITQLLSALGYVSSLEDPLQEALTFSTTL